MLKAHKDHVMNLLTTVETLAGYACENCNDWAPDPEENSNFFAETFFFVIELMSKEAKGWINSLPAVDQ